MTDETIEVPRRAVEALVESLQEAWWVQAAEALSVLRDALYEVPVEEPRTFGSG